MPTPDTATATTMPRSSSTPAVWLGRVLSGLVVLALGMDAVMKLIQADAAVQGTVALGYPASCLTGLGGVLLVSTLLYAVPRTAPFGALLLTAYLGGAVATHVRVGDPFFSHVLSGVYVAVAAWSALWLRDARVKRLVRGIFSGAED
jgi:hypothetical protein